MDKPMSDVTDLCRRLRVRAESFSSQGLAVPAIPRLLAEAAAAIERQQEEISALSRKNPCAGILDHKWLDPVCVARGCQSLALAKDAARLRFLHTHNVDENGYEWGVAMVKFEHGNPVSVLWTLSDHSDLDARMARAALAADAAKGEAAP